MSTTSTTSTGVPRVPRVPGVPGVPAVPVVPGVPKRPRPNQRCSYISDVIFFNFKKLGWVKSYDKIIKMIKLEN